jgi:hypothetical protein
MHEYGSLGLRIKAHWKRHRPKMYADLEQGGTLDEAVSTAEALTSDGRYDLAVMKKMPYEQAWELVRQEWAGVGVPAERGRLANAFR